MYKFVLGILNNTLLRYKYIDYAVSFTDTQPNQGEIPLKTVVIVGGKGWVKWAFMRCPCGCNEVLTLSLMQSYRPNWRVKIDWLNRLTLSPSVWKKDGCNSHFFIEKGRLIWARYEHPLWQNVK